MPKLSKPKLLGLAISKGTKVRVLSGIIAKEFYYSWKEIWFLNEIVVDVTISELWSASLANIFSVSLFL